MIYFAVRFDISVKSHGPIETGEARFDGWRSGILRGQTIVIELYSLKTFIRICSKSR